ncbi:MAG: hypothetical protein AABZ10_10545 [Nitrospirota bacterium]
MNIRILSCAEQELADAVDYYNEQCSGLGFEFAAEVKSTLSALFPSQMHGPFSPNAQGGA